MANPDTCYTIVLPDRRSMRRGAARLYLSALLLSAPLVVAAAQRTAEAAPGHAGDWRGTVRLQALSDLPALDPLPQTDEDGAFEPTAPTIEGGGIPLPGPLIEAPADLGLPASDDPAAPGDLSAPAEEADAPLDILRDLSVLPEPVARMRQLIIEAAETGDIEALRPLLGLRANQTQLAIAGTDGDPVDYLRSTSGDGEGQETLAIILDLFNTGFVARQYDGEDTVYVWPYFFYADVATLTPVQRVELFRVVTAGDYQDMLAYGGYNFYRIGITAAGEWTFFVAGD